MFRVLSNTIARLKKKFSREFWQEPAKATVQPRKRQKRKKRKRRSR